MAISEQDVRHVAMLARLKLTDEQIVKLQGELSGILDHVAAISNLDLADVEPTAHAVDVTNVMRADVTWEGLDRETALLNAPDQQDGYFRIPRIGSEGGDAS